MLIDRLNGIVQVKQSRTYLALKCQIEIAADETLIFFYFYLLKKIRLDVSCESSAGQRIHIKYQVLLSLKNSEKILKTAVCCSPDWSFKG